MTIEEKAREYADYNMAFSQNIIANELTSGYSDFIAGARWMLEKACEYMRSQYPAHYQDYQEWIELADEYVKQFKKAMDE